MVRRTDECLCTPMPAMAIVSHLLSVSMRSSSNCDQGKEEQRRGQDEPLNFAMDGVTKMSPTSFLRNKDYKPDHDLIILIVQCYSRALILPARRRFAAMPYDGHPEFRVAPRAERTTE